MILLMATKNTTSDAVVLFLICASALICLCNLVMGIWRLKWHTVEAYCCDCKENKVWRTHRFDVWRSTKRYVAHGYQSTFRYVYKEKEYIAKTGKFANKQHHPGCSYNIRVNPLIPSMICSTKDMVGNFLLFVFSLAMIIALCLG